MPSEEASVDGARNLFGGQLEDFESVDVESVIASAPRRSCLSYLYILDSAYDAALSEGKLKEANVLRFLHTITSFNPTFDSVEQAYGPRTTLSDGSRSPIPTDLSDFDIQAVKAATKNITDSHLLARLYDVLWILKRDPHAAANGADHYLEAAEALCGEKHWYEAESLFSRSLALAARVGRGKPLFGKVAGSLAQQTEGAAGSLDEVHSSRFMDVMLSHKIGDSSNLATFLSISLRGQYGMGIRAEQVYISSLPPDGGEGAEIPELLKDACSLWAGRRRPKRNDTPHAATILALPAF